MKIQQDRQTSLAQTPLNSTKIVTAAKQEIGPLVIHHPPLLAVISGVHPFLQELCPQFPILCPMALGGLVGLKQQF